jgi:hypothetical protein
MRQLSTFIALAAVLAFSSCQARLRPDFVKVVALLGKPAGIDGGNCKAPGQMADAYMTEIGSKAEEPLSNTLLPFARKAATFCPQSRPYIRTTNDVELKTVAAIIGAQGFAGDGRMQLEPWLWLRVAEGKVIGLEIELDKI